MTLGASVQINGLLKSYGGLTVVDRVSLDVAAGEFVTLLGSSGSGKSTTLMAIAGFVEPEAGEILLDGKGIANLPPERRGLGVVFQSYALFPHYDVFENVAFPLRLRKVPAAEITRRVQNALELVDLAAMAKRRIGQLSGGQQQRVALARALVFSPPVLLMDEPLGALDRKLREQLQTEIKRIQRELSVTVIYVTHDQEEALAMSDRIAIMSRGKISQIGSPANVYEEPETPFVASFLGESNFITMKLAGEEKGFAKVAHPNGREAGYVGRWASGQQPVKTVAAMIRPESLRLGGGEGAGSNGVKAVIKQREYLGASIRLFVETELGELSVRLPRGDSPVGLEAGSSVDLTWRPEDMILFDGEGL